MGGGLANYSSIGKPPQQVQFGRLRCFISWRWMSSSRCHDDGLVMKLENIVACEMMEPASTDSQY